MKIEESFETYNEVENSFMEVAVSQQEQDMLSVRNCLLEKEQERGVEMMQEMASGVLKQLGRVSIDWLEVSEWEAGLLKRLIKEVEGVPGFVARMLDQFLDNINLVNVTKSTNVTNAVNGTQSHV